MNKAMIFPIHKKWVDMIFDGSKQFEFRNKLPKHLVKGMKIYFYEAKGKKENNKNCNGLIKVLNAKSQITNFECDRHNDFHFKKCAACHEGLGMIVGEATVGKFHRIYKGEEIHHSKYADAKDYLLINGGGYLVEKKLAKIVDFEKQGYTNQQYAIELTNVIKYDEEWMKNKFLNETEDCDQAKTLFNPSSQDAYIKCEELENNCVLADDDENYQECPLFEKYSNIPSAPIPKEEFVSWSKLMKYKNDINKLEKRTGNVGYLIEDEEQAYNIGKSWESVEENKYQNLKWNMYITAPPQAPMYVVEREE